jgi:hypothetical protein
MSSWRKMKGGMIGGMPSWSSAKKFRFMFSQKMNCAASVTFHIHVSVSGLYVPTIGPPIYLQQIR